MKNNPGTFENDHNINERILYMSFDLSGEKWKRVLSPVKKYAKVAGWKVANQLVREQ